MADQRLPTVNGDDGQWGDVLNQFIEKEHYNTGLNDALNGSHKSITIRPGTNSAGTAPLKFTSGPLLTNPEEGSVEFLSDKLFFTQTTDATRKTIAAYNDATGATGDLYYRDSGGNFTKLGISATSGSVLNVNSGLPAWGPATTTSATSSTIALRDSRGNISANSIVNGYTTTGTSGGTTNLTAASTYQQYFTGSTTHTVVAPDVTSSAVAGQQWQIINNSTGALTIKPYGSSSLILAISPGVRATLTCISTSTNDVSSWSVTVDVSKQFTVGVTDPSTYGAPNTGDVWIDTN